MGQRVRAEPRATPGARQRQPQPRRGWGGPARWCFRRTSPLAPAAAGRPTSRPLARAPGRRRSSVRRPRRATPGGCRSSTAATSSTWAASGELPLLGGGGRAAAQPRARWRRCGLGLNRRRGQPLPILFCTPLPGPLPPTRRHDAPLARCPPSLPSPPSALCSWSTLRRATACSRRPARRPPARWASSSPPTNGSSWCVGLSPDWAVSRLDAWAPRKGLGLGFKRTRLGGRSCSRRRVVRLHGVGLIAPH
jgi:hypothetical protein